VVIAINALSEAKLVTRRPDPADRRRNIVNLTATGTKQLNTLDERLASVQDELCADLSAAQREQLTRLLNLVLHRLA
ncbi:MAG: MarR family transcriptional regulator, partial [Stackebrandtia sp.]